MPIRYQKWITRQDLRANRHQFYVFGDNAMRVGFGGQAREMRGEPNAIGIATKWAPSPDNIHFFKDDEACRSVVIDDLYRVESHLMRGDTVIVPEDGIGTGLAQLPRRAPKLDQFIKDWFRGRE